MDALRNGTRDLSDKGMPYGSGMKLRAYLPEVLQARMSRRELLKAGGLTSLSVSALWALWPAS